MIGLKSFKYPLQIIQENEYTGLHTYMTITSYLGHCFAHLAWPIISSEQSLLVLCDVKYIVTMTTMSMLATAHQIQLQVSL